MIETVTNKKANFLQRYPFIPAAFFILFAWSILHFVTLYKPALRDIKVMDNSPNLWHSNNNLTTDWQLKITESYLYFQASPQSVWQIYNYQTTQEPILTFNGASTTRKSHIKVFILPERKSKQREVIVTQEDKCFYGFVVEAKNKK